MASPLKVVIADGLAEEGIVALKKLSQITLETHSALDRAALKEQINNIDILIVRSRTKIDKDLLQHADQLKIVLRAGIGLDNVDVPAATDKGIIVMNAPTGNIVTTAEHALALLFAVTRNIPQADSSLRAGKWEKKLFQGNELRGKTLGLLGLGNIGKVVASRAQGIEMKVCAHDPYISAESAAKLNIELKSFDELLEISDYLSIHVPLTSSTKHLINEKAFKKMKKGAYLINCARGGIVDEKAMLDALDEGILSGAALDVFEQEPLEANSPLLKRNDLVMTPHLGASTDEAQVQVGLESAEQIALYVKEGVLKNAVNVPSISLDQLSVLKPHLFLAERLGGFLAQVSQLKTIDKLRVHFSGSVTQYNREVLTLSVLKGFLSPLLSTPVNFVNARKLLKERGIRVEESFEAECRDYNSLIEISVEGDHKMKVAGTLFGKEEPRIVRIDHFNIDAIPEGHLLYTRNVDQPGVIGSLGTVLGGQSINIARMHLGRDPKKKEAIALINIDSEPSEKTLELLKAIKGMLVVRPVYL
ncbi:MAG: phosphoglycerate dehydrogenase [Proteobacteria bacterium]|nr:phosphoglycerate dehydrogenase [Pseudomonadota bacterium]NDC23744.1 phosphoglycerate dehydrogenase [Pseudomonadota bacterium]NDD03852.1 phosphoglycerate dehydrogenase [Pseudomonadota bacterium]NDG26921.1 phosphoglycerate dehydrogenase [Pseudomonadota bacterium]